MKRASIRTGVAALCLMLLPASAQAAHYVLASSGSVTWMPPKSGPGTYVDVLTGGFDVDDGLTTVSLGSGLTAFSVTVTRQTTIPQYQAPPYVYSTPYSYNLASLSSFTLDLRNPAPKLEFALNAGSKLALGSLGTFLFGERSGEPYTMGTMTVALGSVPEPASWAMMVAGFGLVGWTIRGRAQRKVVARA